MAAKTLPSNEAMKKGLACFIWALLSACGAPGANSGSGSHTESPDTRTTHIKQAATKYQYLGTYESFATPMGSSISVLMADGKKIKIASVDSTTYLNIETKRGIPAMRLNGTYGINGSHKASGTGEVFIVREIEYVSGGLAAKSDSIPSSLADFFEIDPNAKGPVTRSELNIRFPDSLKRYFDSANLACFYEQVEVRAADLGDPERLPPIKRVLLSNAQMPWSEMTAADKRLQLARYVTSMALGTC